MSTNPFRRSSRKFPGDNSTNVCPSHPIDIPADSGHHESPLTVNTRSAISNQKHVNFASPPAVPISPASYPESSPESTRFSLAFAVPDSVPSIRPDYSTATQAIPFRVGGGTDEHDGTIKQALYKARVDTDPVVRNPQQDKEDAVKNTLSKFASAPGRPPGLDGHAGAALQMAARQSMDVDTFTRMLLTGNSEIVQDQDIMIPATPTIGSRVSSESSSNVDSASTSHRSTYDRSRSTTEDSSRNSDNSDPVEPTASLLETSEENRRPPPPPSRHGKLIKDKPLPPIPLVGNISPWTQASPEPAITTEDAVEAFRQPPPPPVSRRRSQNSGMTRSNSYQQAHAGEPDSFDTRADGSARAPPPPPTRRSGSFMERRASSDLPTTMEESNSTDTFAPPSRKASDSRPPLPPSRASSTSKRTSLGVLGMAAAPPLPPARRGRGSSRSSIDSQRPSSSALTDIRVAEFTRSSNEYSRPEAEGRKIPAGRDLLADLAALQREVDDARRSAGR